MFRSQEKMSRGMEKAVETGNLQAVKNLITKHADDRSYLNAVDEFGNTALLKAIRYGYLDIAEFLLSCRDIDVNREAWQDKFEPDQEYRCAPLNLAVRKGYINIAKIILKKPHVNVNNFSFYAHTVMDTAIHEHHADIVRILLLHPTFDFSWLDQQNNIFSWAHQHLSRESFNTLMTQPDVHITSIMTPDSEYLRSLKLSYNLHSTLTVLLSLPDFDNRIRLMRNETVLTLATDKTNIEFVSALLAHEHFNWQAKYHGGKNILMLAAERNMPELLTLILEKKIIDINARDDEGNTALILAAMHHDNAVVINKLLTSGADRTLINNRECNAHMEARRAQHRAITPLLRLAPYTQEEFRQFLLWRQQCAKEVKIHKNTASPIYHGKPCKASNKPVLKHK